MARKTGLQIGPMENAPDWYGKSLDELDFEWSPEEKLEIERYCEKILKNAEEEEMTPLERFEATMQGKDKDRLHIDVHYYVPYAVRTLDSWADAVKPGDLYQRPKLHLKGHLATVARFKLDIINWYTIAYCENFWGGTARMIDYGTPMFVGEYPVKTMDDIVDVEIPDPKKHGLYPGYLWAVRELVRIMAEYGVDKVMPLVVSFCGDPLGTVHLGMTGFTHGLLIPKRDPELFKVCMDKAADWSIKFGQAVREFNPNAMYLCSYMGALPPKQENVMDNEWIMDVMAKVGKGVMAGDGNKPYMWHVLGASGWMEWMPLYYPHGALAPSDNFQGWWVGPYVPHEEVYKYSRENDLVCGCSIMDDIVLNGNIPAIEESLKGRAECARLYPKHFLGLGTIDYWTPHPHFDATVELAKKLGKF